MAEEQPILENGFEQSRPSSHKLLWGGAVGLLLLVVGGLVVFWLDPFGWHIIERLNGRYDAALQAIPASSPAYIGLNLLKANEEQLARLQETFARAAPGAEAATLRENLEKTMMDEVGLSLEEDLLPWVGQFAGLGLLPAGEESAGRETAPEWVLAIESRDREASDAFLQKLSAGWAARTGETAVIEAYQGIDIIRFRKLSFGRSGGLVVVGTSVAAVQQAVDAQAGESLADSEAAAEAINQLPSERLVTMFFNLAQIQTLFVDLLPEGLPLDVNTLPANGVRGTAVSLTLVEDGLQLDSAALLDLAQLGQAGQTLLAAEPTGEETAKNFPPDTLLFASGGNAGALWQAYRQMIISQSSESDFNESMQLFAQEFGFNPDTDFFPLLDGSLSFGVMAGQEKSLAGVEIAALVGTSDEDLLAESLAAISANLGDPQTGVGTISQIEKNGLTLFEVESILLPDIKPAYGTGGGFLMLGSSLGALQRLPLGTGSTLAEDGRFQTTWQAFPDGMRPGFYLDVTGGLALAENSVVDELEVPGQSTAFLQPITAIAAGGRIDGETAVQRVMIFIDWENNTEGK